MSVNPNLIYPIFKTHTSVNEAKSKAAGRPIYDELEVVVISFAGDKQKVAVFPAHDIDPEATRENDNVPTTYAMRYGKQYRAFKNQTTQVASGTPLEELTFLTQARRMELKALNIHTAEALAALDGTPLKQIGPGGRELKNKAQAYIDKATGTADVTAMAAELAALKQQLAERDAAIQHLAAGSSPAQDGDGDDAEDEDGQEDAESDQGGTDKSLEDCTDAELKAFIKRETGEPVRGNPSRQTLIDRAMELATAPGGDDAQD
jgi:glutathione peroxidase-family protein